MTKEIARKRIEKWAYQKTFETGTKVDVDSMIASGELKLVKVTFISLPNLFYFIILAFFSGMYKGLKSWWRTIPVNCIVDGKKWRIFLSDLEFIHLGWCYIPLIVTGDFMFGNGAGAAVGYNLKKFVGQILNHIEVDNTDNLQLI